MLTAIAIPVFTTQLEKSREATDLSNVRAAYAEIMVAAVSDEAPATSANSAYTLSRTGTAGSYVYTATVNLKQQVADWQTPNALTAVAGVTATGAPTVGGTGTITFTASTNTVTIVYA